MLKFVSSYLALSYLAFATLGIVGVLQLLAARQSFVGLALFDYRRMTVWHHAVGPALVVLAYAWFFGTRREILTPGPAGTELVILFGGGVLLALALTLAGASLLRPYRQEASPLPSEIEAQSVELSQGQMGTLYSGGAGSLGKECPGICLIPDPAMREDQLGMLTAALVGSGMVVLVPKWESRLQRYPDAMVLSPLSLSYLSQHPLVDSNRLAIVGAGLGGDLALRAASADRKVAAAVALSPLLSERNALPSLGLLREMTYAEAITWCLGGRRRPLAREIDAAAALAQGSHPPALIVFGGHDALLSPLHVSAQMDSTRVDVRTVPREGHWSLVSSPGAAETVAQWLTEKLNEC